MQSIYQRDLLRLASREGVQRCAGEEGAVDMSGGPQVARFATRIMSLVAAARDRDGADLLDEGLLDSFVAAALSPDDQRIGKALTTMRRLRVSDQVLVDGYIPAAARRMGQCWVEDTLGFAAVSMGCARLQTMLHHVGRDVMADQTPVLAGEGVGVTVLFVVPAREQHTLGAMVAAHQLRRRGASVCLRFVPSVPELDHLARARDFDVAMISVAGDEHLDEAAGLVRGLRAISRAPIVAGGAARENEVEKLLSLGADHINSDPVAALRFVEARRASRSAHVRA